MSGNAGGEHAAEKKGPLAKFFGGALVVVGGFLILALTLYFIGPLLGMVNAGLFGINTEFQQTPRHITAFGVNFNLMMTAIFRLVFTVLVLAVVFWLLGLAFKAMFKKEGDDHHH